MTDTNNGNAVCCAEQAPAGSCCTKQEAATSQESTTYCPRFDIQETDDELVLYGDLPGVVPEDLEIRFEKGELTVHGKVAPQRSGTEALYREYGTGDFYRTFTVAETVDADAITAELHSGVLTLHLPKAEAAKPRRIQVRT